MDYFNARERKLQRWFRRYRDRLLNPVNERVTTLGLTPNQISLTGVLFLAAAAAMPQTHWAWVILFLLFYLLCDGLDGPLARYQGRTHRGGALVDIVADQLGVVFLSAAGIFHLQVNGVTALMFAAGYIAFVALATYANQISAELKPFIRVKYPFYLLYILSLTFGWVGALDLFFIIFAPYYWVLVLIATRTIYAFHEGQEG